jgi:hypothetical protein
MNELSLEQLKAVVAIKEQIASLEIKLDKIVGEKAIAAPVKRGRKPKLAKAVKVITPAPAETAAPAEEGRDMSTAAKARISAAAKARWAKIKAAKGEKPAAPAPAPKKKKAGISAAGRAKISAMMKARWAARKKKA